MATVTQRKPKAPRQAQSRSIHHKELQTVHDMCVQLRKLSDALGQDYAQRRHHDFIELKNITDQSKNEDEMSLLAIDAAMSIINLSSRKTALRKRLQMRVREEKELTIMMQSHKDDLMTFIWKRRLQSKREVRSLFQGGMGMIGRFGDLVSESCLESVQAFEKHNLAKLLKDAIHSGQCEAEDIAGLIYLRVYYSFDRR